MYYSLIGIVLGFLMDLAFGDPKELYHPVRWIGVWIKESTKIIRNYLPRNKAGELFGGGLLVVSTSLLCSFLTWGILFLCYRKHPWLGLCMEAWLCYRILATKSLKVESHKVYEKLKEHDLPGARKAVSMIVGRDTKELKEEEIVKATVETIAENTSDGVIAPLIYLLIGGPVLGFFYKAVNTMDSMVGYRNEEYRYYGFFAAKLDDVMNFLPARISAFLMIGAAFLLGYDWRGGIKIWKRDRRNHNSPNAAQTEGVMAGALSLKLAGDAKYFGEIVHKPTIGDGGKKRRRKIF